MKASCCRWYSSTRRAQSKPRPTGYAIICTIIIAVVNKHHTEGLDAWVGGLLIYNSSSRLPPHMPPYLLRMVTYIYDHVTVNIGRPHINVYMQKMTVMWFFLLLNLWFPYFFSQTTWYQYGSRATNRRSSSKFASANTCSPQVSLNL